VELLWWTWVASRSDVGTNFPATLAANAARRLIRRRYADRPVRRLAAM
jgi:hypothetical protein